MSVASPSLRLPSTILGAAAGPGEEVVDARWLMAYSAALGETDPRYFETGGAAGPAAHPLFAVCYEWPLAVELRERVIGEAISPYSVHATHDLVIHRPPRAGDVLRTTARIVDVRALKAGSLVVTRLHTVDRAGAPVTSTHYGSIYRGVGCDGASGPVPSTAPPPSGAPRWEERVGVSGQLAHVYTECARIWNPIHTDIAVARAAGLPGLIL